MPNYDRINSVHKCYNCGKEFGVGCVDMYTYKRGHVGRGYVMLCSYTCMRQYDKQKQVEKERKRKELSERAKEYYRKKSKERYELRTNNIGHQELQEATE